jgi:DNA polymerase-1
VTLSPDVDRRPVLIIDALNLFMRHYVVNPTMSDAGTHMGGWLGFLKSLRLLTEKIHPKQVIVAWEGGGSSRRRAIFPQYKSNRKPQKLNRFYEDDIPDTTQNRDHQIRLIIESLKCVPVKQLYVADCEADDVIGYIARYKFSDDNLVIVSSDRDLYQLLSDRVTQWSPGQKRFITPSDVRQKFRICVQNFCLARAFIGDPSDAIPGIKGAGFKSLARMFPVLTDSEVTFDDIIELARIRANEKNPPKLCVNILESKDIFIRNWKLIY